MQGRRGGSGKSCGGGWICSKHAARSSQRNNNNENPKRVLESKGKSATYTTSKKEPLLDSSIQARCGEMVSFPEIHTLMGITKNLKFENEVFFSPRNSRRQIKSFCALNFICRLLSWVSPLVYKDSWQKNQRLFMWTCQYHPVLGFSDSKNSMYFDF